MRLLKDRLLEMDHVTHIEHGATVPGVRPTLILRLNLVPKMHRIKGAATRFGFNVQETYAGAVLTHSKHRDFSVEQDTHISPSTFVVRNDEENISDELRGKVLGFFRQLGQPRKKHLRIVKRN